MKANRWVMLWGAATGLGWSAFAAAQESPVDAMIQGDELLRMVFGLDPTSLASLLSGNTPTIIATVALILNSIALFVAVGVLLLTFFTGMMQQAHEGEVLGRRYSTLWVPLRFLLTFAYLTPLASGYSILQILIMWVAMGGSLLADRAWNDSVVYVQDNASVVGVPMMPATRGLVTSMFESAVCANRLNQLADASGQSWYVDTREQEISIRQPSPSLTADLAYLGEAAAGNPVLASQARVVARQPHYQTGLSYDVALAGSTKVAVCGAYLVDRPALSPTDGQTTARQQQNLVVLKNRLAVIASHMQAGSSMATVRAELIEAEAEYAASERDRAVAYVAATANKVTQMRINQTQYARATGWTAAGTWFMTFAALSDTVMSQAAAVPQFQGPRIDQLPVAIREDLAPYLARASVLSTPGIGNPSMQQSGALPTQMQATGNAAAPPGRERVMGNPLDWFSTWVTQKSQQMYDAATGVVTSLFKDMNPATKLADAMSHSAGADPIVLLAAVGHTVLDVCEIAFAAGAALGLISSVIFSVVSGIVTPFFIGASALAYYIPMLPYVLWMMGMASWLLLMIEAVVLAPVWAVAHAMPEGEGWAGRHAQQGYMLIVALFLRPILMIIGLLAAMLVMRAICFLIGSTFAWVMSATQGAETMGIVSMMAYFVVLVGLFVASARVAFSLIHVIPDRALRAVGGSESLGDMGGERHTHAGAMVIAGAVVSQLAQLRVRVRRNDRNLPPPRGSLTAPRR